MCGEKKRLAACAQTAEGSPPRVRGKGWLLLTLTVRNGITPACAGKRLCYSLCLPPLWDHPRVCGEKFDNPKIVYSEKGSPPRVRGKVLVQCVLSSPLGITPACAGKRSVKDLDAGGLWDHPRVCGEKQNSFQLSHTILGSPPRVRGKEQCFSYTQLQAGITPACAGKSQLAKASLMTCWDHPRVCGEKERTNRCACWTEGSPPRVRGKD